VVGSSSAAALRFDKDKMSRGLALCGVVGGLLAYAAAVWLA